jgi:aspartate/methionine/tyrosine aminotransferase
MIMEAEAPDSLGEDRFRYNLAESSVRDRSLGELGIEFGDMILPYGDHFGAPELRALIAGLSDDELSAEHVLVTAGAAGALFIIATSLLEPGDHIVVGFPNYATNYETPGAIGARVEHHEQDFDRGFRIDVDAIERQVTPDTRLLSLTCPHNPSGAVFSPDELARLIDLVERMDCWLVLDQTYREMTYGEPLPVAAALSDNVISVNSMSKTWGLPGIRIGWLTSRNPELMERFISAKEQIGITGSLLDESVAVQTLSQKERLLPEIRRETRVGLELVRRWVEREAAVEWVEPGGGVTCCVRIPAADDAAMRRIYETLKGRYRTAVGPGYWFKLPLNQMRVGFGYTHPQDTEQGLECISHAIGEYLN